ncbi:MAG: two-component system sensor histidine kinase RstB [Gammaproteobacteria bacterium]|jgi:two-component system sensor histidine kinase RstB
MERLKERVDGLGAGDLSSRVEVEGRDEIASLASSFNGAAKRIEKLVNAPRNLLASASHELRSPLTRVRIAVELLPNPTPDVRHRLVQDINELDELIEELLLGSRLEAEITAPVFESVDILALLAEEAAPVEADVAGVPVTVLGDRTLLRRMLRNLLENARRHGRGANISARVQRTDSATVISVEDDGPGVEANEGERIFEPFYRPAGMREGKDKGVGLGLSLVRQIARHHHGDVQYVVEAHQAYFEIHLPAR